MEYDITFSGKVLFVEAPKKEGAPKKITVAKEKSTKKGTRMIEVKFDYWDTVNLSVGDEVVVKGNFDNFDWNDKVYTTQVAKEISIVDSGEEPEEEIPF